VFASSLDRAVELRTQELLGPLGLLAHF
jgi:hypothetical protein